MFNYHLKPHLLSLDLVEEDIVIWDQKLQIETDFVFIENSVMQFGDLKLLWIEKAKDSIHISDAFDIVVIDVEMEPIHINSEVILGRNMSSKYRQKWMSTISNCHDLWNHAYIKKIY